MEEESMVFLVLDNFYVDFLSGCMFQIFVITKESYRVTFSLICHFLTTEEGKLLN